MRLIVITALLALLALAGCTQAVKGKGSSPAPSTSASTSAPSTPAPLPLPTDTETTPAPADATSLAFGDTWEWTDGLSVVVDVPKIYTPGPYAADDPAAHYISFRITLTNKTGKRFDPNLVMISLTSGKTDVSESTVYDDTVGNSPSTVLLNGRSVTWKVAYGVPSTHGLVLELTPDFEYDPAVYQD
jgi:hypothetical protein